VRCGIIERWRVVHCLTWLERRPGVILPDAFCGGSNSSRIRVRNANGNSLDHECQWGSSDPQSLLSACLYMTRSTLAGEIRKGAIHGDAFAGCLRTNTEEWVGRRAYHYGRSAGVHARGHPRSNFARAFQAVCPPQELPAPAVQPKQCRAVTMERACQLSSLKLEMCAPSGIAI